MIYTKLKEHYIPKYYVITKEIPLTEVNKKVDFVKLEKEDIFDNNSHNISTYSFTMALSRNPHL